MGVVDQIGYRVYVDDAATGKVKKLSDTFRAAGESGKKAGDDITEGGKKAEKEVGQLERTLGRLQRTMTAIAGVFIAREIIRGFTGMIKMGIEYNKTLEQSKLGIAGVLAAQMQVVSANGKELTGLSKLVEAKKKAVEITMDMREANLKTAATFEELIIMFQQALPHALARGFDIKQTEQFVTAMSQAATSMGIPLNMMSEEMRAMLKGTITAKNTLIAVALDMDKNVIKSLKGAELFDYLMAKLHAFELLSGDIKKSFQGLFTDMKQELEQTLGENLAGFFTVLEEDMVKLGRYFKSDDFATHIKNLNTWLLTTEQTITHLGRFLDSLPSGTLKYGLVGTLLIGGHPWMATFIALIGYLPKFEKSLEDLGIITTEKQKQMQDALEKVKQAEEEVNKIKNAHGGTGENANTGIDYSTDEQNALDKRKKAYDNYYKTLAKQVKEAIDNDKKFSKAQTDAIFKLKGMDKNDWRNNEVIRSLFPSDQELAARKAAYFKMLEDVKMAKIKSEVDTIEHPAQKQLSRLDKQFIEAQKYIKENTKSTADALVSTAKASGDAIDSIASQTDDVISKVHKQALVLRNDLKLSVDFWDKKIKEAKMLAAYDEAANRYRGGGGAARIADKNWMSYLQEERLRAVAAQNVVYRGGDNVLNNSNNKTTTNNYSISFNPAFLNADKASMRRAADMIEAELRRRETRTR